METVIIAHNLRSCYNVGSLMRTCDGLGAKLIMSGTTPYPKQSDDTRLPHIANRAHRQIAKTALGAESTVPHLYLDTLQAAIEQACSAGYQVAALEQTPHAIPLPTVFDQPWAIIVGNERDGLTPDEAALVKTHWQIPMSGQKKSFNVTVAATIALWQLYQK